MQNENIDNTTLRAIEEYSNKIASNEIIEECDFSFNIDTIRAYIQDYIATTNERPTIIIDYLQILAPSNPKFTDKQQVDYNITSCIEYTADVLLTMQLKILSENNTPTNEEIREAKKKIPREVQLVCLKNRNGKSNFTINFDFNPVFNAFKEQPRTMQEL